MFKNHSILIAKILIFISFILLVWSVIIYNEENQALVDPSKGRSLNPTQEETNITSKDNVDIESNADNESENHAKNNSSSKKENSDSTSSQQQNSSEPSNQNQDQNSSENANSNQNQATPPAVTTPAPQPSITEINNNLRTTIQNNYGITILYGEETNGYSVGGLRTNVEYNEYTIQNALNSLNATMAIYPYGFFQEIRNGGIPLTLYLIKNYSTPGVTGATNAFNNRADISISLDYSFVESFNHEVFHYMEKYIKKNGDNFNSWSSLNPIDFRYGNINGNLSYNRTFSADSPFVNNYAQSSGEEDRASTFEYMMGNSKASCLNYEKMVWRKAQFLAQKIDLTFNTVSPNITEHWERFIY